MKKRIPQSRRILLAIIFSLIFNTTNHAKDWKGAVVHHSATKTGNAEIFRQYHINNNGWDDIGYHFVILRDGTVERGRSLKLAGAHAKGRNATHIGICMVGEDEYTDAQVKGLITLLKSLYNTFDIREVEPHHEQCPGEGIDLDEIKKEVEK